MLYNDIYLDNYTNIIIFINYLFVKKKVYCESLLQDL